MSDEPVVGRAPGKIILFGEHAVVYGEPAIGLALSKNASATLKPGRGQVRLRLDEGINVAVSENAATPKDLVAAVLKPDLANLDVELALEFPPMSGFGSSAAIAVALIRAQDQLNGVPPRTFAVAFERALGVETVAHAKPSGVDPAICLKGGLVRFVRAGLRPQVSRLKMKLPAHLVVASAGGHGGTRQSVTRLADMKATTPKLVEQAMQTLGETARVGGQALLSGDFPTAGLAMDLANGVLSGFGLVAPAVEQGLAICRGAGALGAKMSGAGGDGGAFCALFDGVRRARRAVNLLNEAGYMAWMEPLAESSGPTSDIEPSA